MNSCYAIFPYSEKANEFKLWLTITKSKLRLYWRLKRVIGVTMKVKLLPPTPFDCGVVIVTATRGGVGE